MPRLRWWWWSLCTGIQTGPHSDKGAQPSAQLSNARGALQCGEAQGARSTDGFPAPLGRLCDQGPAWLVNFPDSSSESRIEVTNYKRPPARGSQKVN